MNNKEDSSGSDSPCASEELTLDTPGTPPENTAVQKEEADSTTVQEEETESATNMATPGLRKPECFSGANPEEFPAWLAKFESTAHAGGWNDKRLDTLPAYLTQRAFQIYEKLQPTEKDTYAHLTAALKTKMGLGEKKMAWRVQLRQTSRSPGESLDKYIYRLHNLAKQAYPDSTEAERETHVNEQFILGQPKDLQFDLLKGGDNTLDRNIELAKLYESASELATGKRSVNHIEADGEEKMSTLSGRSHIGSEEKEDTSASLNVIKSLLQELKEKSYPEKVTHYPSLGRGRGGTQNTGNCYSCGQPGHLARECGKGHGSLPTPFNNLVCYKCQGVGHLSKNCTTDAVPNWTPRTPTTCRLECQRCNNRGHDAANCRTDIWKTCRVCFKKGHLEEECRSRGNYQQAELAQNDGTRNRLDTKNLVAPGKSGDNWS